MPKMLNSYTFYTQCLSFIQQIPRLRPNYSNLEVETFGTLFAYILVTKIKGESYEGFIFIINIRFFSWCF